MVAQLFSEVDTAYKSLFATGKAVRYDGAIVPEQEWADLVSQDFEKIRPWAKRMLQQQSKNTGWL